MRYPEFLPENGTIGTVAPSFGVYDFPYEDRYQNAVRKLNELGHQIKEAGHIYGAYQAVSADGRTRAEEFMEMMLNDEVDFVQSVAGGEMMMDMLPHVDFEVLKQAKPKWFMGISDNTNLVFTLPILADMAAIYGPCCGSFGMEKWYRSLKEAYQIMRGERNYQKNFPKYEPVDFERKVEDPFAGFDLKEKVVYKSLDGENHTFSGRMIGGCLDILTMLCGTRFAPVGEYLERYRDDGFIWFLEACDLNVLGQKRGLWQLKEAGWFKYCQGIIYGRPLLGNTILDISVADALRDNLADLNVPVIYDCDFGHVAPGWTIISGALATFRYEDGKGKITYRFR